jgi:hypothetical protein
MRNWIPYIFVSFIFFVFITCDNISKSCSCPAGTTHEPNENCCNGMGCNCSIAEPAIKEFTVEFVFANHVGNGINYTAIIKDKRIACGSKNLNELGILDYIKTSIEGAYNSGTGPGGFNKRNVFHNVFGDFELSETQVVILIENLVDYYNFPAIYNYPDKDFSREMAFHIDWLKEEPEDIESKIITAVSFFYLCASFEFWSSPSDNGGLNLSFVKALDHKVYYTLDGSMPTINSILYDGETININKTTTVKAIIVAQYLNNILISRVYIKEYILE